jgi:UTP--glucose-1-phosphate uridylyltransferase
MVEAYNQYGTSVVGLKRTPEPDISSYGVVNGVWVEEQRILNISEFAEKPTLDYARTNLHVPHIAEDEYLTVFGQYIIKPEIFDLLETNIRNNLRERGEFQLTSALDRLRQMDGFLGLMIDGRRFDIGIPEHYLETLQLFAQP